MNTLAILGTGLIGSSTALALRAAGFTGDILGVDSNPAELACALAQQAITHTATLDEAAAQADVLFLAVPVLAILDTLHRLAPRLTPGQLVTDAGSTKLALCELAIPLYNGPAQPRYLPGHPMAGKESGGAALAEAMLFHNATWLFTPIADETALEADWRAWVVKLGAYTQDLDPTLHDKLCAWVSHMPQMVSTAMAALFEDEFGNDPVISAVGGRALREMTRLGASPYTMWRDVALTNTQPIAATLFALEQRLAHLREYLRTPELRDEFAKANTFRRNR